MQKKTNSAAMMAAAMLMEQRKGYHPTGTPPRPKRARSFWDGLRFHIWGRSIPVFGGRV